MFLLGLKGAEAQAQARRGKVQSRNPNDNVMITCSVCSIWFLSCGNVKLFPGVQCLSLTACCTDSEFRFFFSG